MIQNLTNREIADLIANGDFPGHPFRGNQYADGNGGGEHSAASTAAHAASKGAKDKKSHRAAAKAHLDAASAHEDAGNSDTADYHHAMAAFHSKESATFGRGKVKNRIADLLNVADDDAAAAAITALQNRVAALEGEQVDALLANRRIEGEKARAVKPVLATLKNREDREAWLDTVLGAAPAAAADRAGKPGERLTNRASAGAPTVTATAGADKSRELDGLVREAMLKNRTSYEVEFNALKSKRPDLFAVES